MKKLAVIPARGGSKRIPRKNIKLFFGKPIIAYSIKAALESGCFDEVMVSTDDEEIAGIAREYGANVPFLRSEATANDHAGLGDVVIEVIDKFKESDRFYDYACCILPTAPLLQAEDLQKAFQTLQDGMLKTVFPVVRFEYPILRSLKIESGRILMNWPEYYTARSQDLAPAYHDCGLFYWINVTAFENEKKFFTDNSGSIELPSIRVQDIDTENDWKICEMKYRLLQESASNKNV